MAQRTDEYFYKQPELSFIEELKKPFFTEKPHNFGKRQKKENEFYVGGMYLKDEFSGGALLEKSVEDFNRFLSVYQLGGSDYPVYLRRRKEGVFESYRLEVKSDHAAVYSGDTEGIRRGLICLEDEIIAAEAPFLKEFSADKAPWLKTRMTRGFFSPTNRPPKNIDELSNDIDYYPENYLCRLMHDGTNALWIYTRFKDLVPSPYVKGYGAGYERRIEKLNGIINKAAWYGIKIYLMVIEPAAFNIGVESGYEELMGVRLLDQYCYCPYSPRGADFLYDTGKRLASMCPGLAGVITIMGGERLTTCAMVPDRLCEKCRGRVATEIESLTMNQLIRGFKEVNPAFEVISWTYGHREKTEEEIARYIGGLSADVIEMENFEDRGKCRQLGKTRHAIDYWLSYIGPSDMFRFAAVKARERGVPVWAKMQICSSHENATLPYIPSPVHVFKKLKQAKELGVSGIVECWYFGNYPSVMSKAVGELAFYEKLGSRETFISKLAGITYGNSAAPAVAECWRYMYESYSNCPFNIMFSYYGPFHDGVVWDLALKPKNLPLPRTWQLTDVPDGDRIAECFMYGHTHEEVTALFERVVQCASAAKEALQEHAKGKANGSLTDLYTVLSAYLVLAESALNILRFYKLRRYLGRLRDDPLNILSKMKEIVLREIENSRLMTGLCKADSRLGYHSEAEGYKFFPEKLEARVEKLKKLLQTEFPEVEQRIKEGLIPLEFYSGEAGPGDYIIEQSDITRAPWQYFAEGRAAVRFACVDGEMTVELKGENIAEEDEDSYRFVLLTEFEPMYPEGAVLIRSDGSWFADGEKIQHLGMSGSAARAARRKWNVSFLDEEKTHVRVSFSVKSVEPGQRYIKLSALVNGVSWQEDKFKVTTLGKQFVSPGQYKKIFFAREVQHDNRHPFARV